ncbi:hypothetical protein G647_01118 [Cladophialophora carrionii CBS 160.54]|uniref:Allergen n=1 Tax=Cladophialophora carrionii CBS 160.54 TaxID=1279043 RepID=V9DRT8_9EURO|nr:uncharacterized protein G647_01118 [Cladophialophora carrionii CBS 160.54]ETI28667.1 hypothetical protein G647_01118 [Cladophialophora carrionii CBS 160.54]
MEAARAAVQKLTGNRGHHTSVEETVVPAVTHEAVKPHRHEEVTQAVDREVHQHHYHTTVQPLTHQERLPEKHTHNILPAEHREFHHDDESATKERLAAEMANFKSHSTTHETVHTQAAAPTVTGEHVHHHVHETVVPVVHKETIQPEVVHTTIPVHETHHAAAQHHGLSALPMKTLDEFKAAGGALVGGHHSSHEEYEGAPRPYNDKLATTFDKLEEKFHSGHHSTGTTTGTTGLGDHNKAHRPTDSGVGGVGNDLTSGGIGRDHHHHENGSSVGDKHLGARGAGPMGTTEGAKPSLADRMNPRVDADGDGKRGFMD